MLPPRTVTLAPHAEAFRIRAVSLHVTRGPDKGRSIRVEQPTFIIGVGDTADFRLSDSGVSREHLSLTLTPVGVKVRDNGSKNGTFLGTSRIHELTITHDAAIIVGETTLAIAVATNAVELPVSASPLFGRAIGISPIMRHLFATLERAAASDLTVLIEGESGVGKDVLAQAVHEKSTRKNEPFVVVDCSSIPENLIESELFGHQKGAFTGADQARRGAFEAAHRGTLFLDEVGELPIDMQPKLLRALEQREIKPVGASSSKAVDVRVIAATNRRLAEAARTGEFRSDLFYRLAVVRVGVPPLRDRPEDIVPIAQAMLRERDPQAQLAMDFASMLEAYSWPGNVRELRNVIDRYAALGESDNLFDQAAAKTVEEGDDLTHLPYREARKQLLDRFDGRYAERIMSMTNGNISRAAEIAEVSRPTLYQMLERAGRKR